jgi:hypothetical protein
MREEILEELFLKCTRSNINERKGKTYWLRACISVNDFYTGLDDVYFKYFIESDETTYTPIEENTFKELSTIDYEVILLLSVMLLGVLSMALFFASIYE